MKKQNAYKRRQTAKVMKHPQSQGPAEKQESEYPLKVLLEKAHKQLDEIDTHIIHGMQGKDSLSHSKVMIIQELANRGKLERHHALYVLKEPVEKPTQIEIDDFIFDIEEIMCEYVTEPAGHGCGYGIEEDGQIILTACIKEFLGRAGKH